MQADATLTRTQLDMQSRASRAAGAASSLDVDLCAQGGQLWTEAAFNGTTAGITQPDANKPATIPAGFCSTGFHSLYLAFAFALGIDLALQVRRAGLHLERLIERAPQVYAYFLNWRLVVRMRQRRYDAVKASA
jgi:hypothetical protein